MSIQEVPSIELYIRDIEWTCCQEEDDRFLSDCHLNVIPLSFVEDHKT